MLERTTLFHVSPSYNFASIQEKGIDPVFSRGARMVSWWTLADELLWAIAKCSYRFHVPVSNLVVFEAEMPDFPLQRTSWVNVFTAKTTI